MASLCVPGCRNVYGASSSPASSASALRPCQIDLRQVGAHGLPGLSRRSQRRQGLGSRDAVLQLPVDWCPLAGTEKQVAETPRLGGITLPATLALVVSRRPQLGAAGRWRSSSVRTSFRTQRLHRPQNRPVFVPRSYGLNRQSLRSQSGRQDLNLRPSAPKARDPSGETHCRTR